MKNKNILISMGVNTAACYAVVYENQVILNSYTALSIFIFFMVIIATIAMHFNTTEIKELIKRQAKDKELSKLVKSVDTVSDIVLLFFLFGYGYWFLGFMWYCIHFLFTALINEAVKSIKITRLKTRGYEY